MSTDVLVAMRNITVDLLIDAPPKLVFAVRAYAPTLLARPAHRRVGTGTENLVAASQANDNNKQECCTSKL